MNSKTLISIALMLTMLTGIASMIPFTNAATCAYSIAASNNLHVNPGGSDATVLTVSLTSGSCSWVSLSVLSWGGATGLSATFSITNSTPTYQSVLTVTALSTATIGTFSMIVQGTGDVIQVATITVTVGSISTCDYSLLASPNSLTITPGSSAQTTLTITATSGTCSSVTLSSLSLGGATGLTLIFSPNSGTPPFTSNMVIYASTTASSGTFTITIQASAGSIIKTIPVTVTVGTQACTYYLIASPNIITTTAGTSTQTTISVTSTGGSCSSPVYLTVLNWGGLSGSATFSTNNQNPPFTSILTIVPSQTSGTFTLSIGNSYTSTTIQVTVQATAVCNYAISSTPITVLQGSQTQTTITMTPTIGTCASTIYLALTSWGGATGLTINFSPSSGIPSFTSTITVHATSQASPGTFQATIQGSAGANPGIETTLVQVTVQSVTATQTNSTTTVTVGTVTKTVTTTRTSTMYNSTGTTMVTKTLVLPPVLTTKTLITTIAHTTEVVSVVVDWAWVFTITAIIFGGLYVTWKLYRRYYSGE